MPKKLKRKEPCVICGSEESEYWKEGETCSIACDLELQKRGGLV